MGGGQDRRREFNEALEDAESTFVAGVAGTAAGAAGGAALAAETVAGAAAGAGFGGLAGAAAGVAAALGAQELGDWAGSDPQAEQEAEIMAAAVQLHHEHPGMTGPEALEQARREHEQR
jgi:hypothetical protein